jgi:hypothetical protein
MENQIKSIAKSIQEMTNPQQVDEGMYTPGSGYGKDAQSKADKYNSLSTADQKKINSIEKILNIELRDIHLNNRCAYFNNINLDLTGNDLKKLGGLVKRFSFDNDYDDLWIECYY